METIDYKSEEGITIALLEGIMLNATLLRNRFLTTPEILEAIKDLQEDKSLEYLLKYNRSL